MLTFIARFISRVRTRRRLYRLCGRP